MSIERAFTLLLWCMMLWSCKAERDPCLQPTQVHVHLSFKHKPDTGTTLKDTLLPNLNFGAMKQDTLKFMYYGAKNVGRISFPLSNTNDTVHYWLQPDSSTMVVDTLRLVYARKLHFISNACGYNFYYTLKEIYTTHNLIDTAYIRKAEVTNDVNQQHLEVLY